MAGFLWASLIGSIVLTVLLNAIPRLLPGPSRRAEQKLHDYLVDATEPQPRKDSSANVRVFFPWKAMLAASILLTVIVNLAGWLVR